MGKRSSSPLPTDTSDQPDGEDVPAGFVIETRQNLRHRGLSEKARVEKLGREARRQRVTRGSVYFLNSPETRFCRAVAAGATLEAAAVAAGADGAERIQKIIRTYLKRPVVQAAIYELMPRASEEQLAKLATNEVMRLALMPDHLLADQPRFVDKRWALETALKLQNKFPGGDLAKAGAEAVGFLIRAAERRAGKREAITVDEPAQESPVEESAAETTDS
jgi:hypothetical protein